MKPAPQYVTAARVVGTAAVRFGAKAFGLGLGPVALASAGLVIAIECLLRPAPEIDEDDKALKEKEFQVADQVWRAALKEIQHETATNNSDLERIRDKAREGLFPPLSEIRIEGAFAKEIKKGFDDIEDILVKEKVHHIEVAAEIVEIATTTAAMSAVSYPLAGARAAAKLAGKIISSGVGHRNDLEKEMTQEGEKIAKISLTWQKNKILHAATIDKFLRNESAYIVWEFARNGVKTIETIDGVVLLRWGQRTEADMKRWFKP